MGTTSVTLSLDADMHAALVRRAQSMGKRPSDYLRQLIDAAYAARVGYEKKLPATDDDLDQAVRAVFCLSGEFDMRAIAKATGFPKSLVADILKGFAIVAPTLRGEQPRPPQQEAGGADKREDDATPEAGTAAPPLRHGWPAEVYEKIREMWAAGETTSVIAKAIGKTNGALSVWAGKNRDICPKRSVTGTPI